MTALVAIDTADGVLTRYRTAPVHRRSRAQYAGSARMTGWPSVNRADLERFRLEGEAMFRPAPKEAA